MSTGTRIDHARAAALDALQPNSSCADKVSSFELAQVVAAAITGQSKYHPETHQLARSLNSDPLRIDRRLTVEQKRDVLAAVQPFFPQDAADLLAGQPTRDQWARMQDALALQRP